MILIKLFLSFIKIGILGFGGGYAMIPLIQNEIVKNNWLTELEFIEIISIAEITPGPIAINSATYVGYKVYGVFGSILATLGVTLPSLILLILISNFFFKNYNHKAVKNMLEFIKPVVAGLILSAAIILAKKTFFIDYNNCVYDISKNVQKITVLTFLIVSSINILYKNKVNPILLILISALIGYFSMYLI